MKGLGQADEAKVAESVAELETTLAVYEKILSKQGYIGGSEVTLVDLYHLPFGTILQKVGLGSLFEKYPAVHKWFAELQARESWKKASTPK
jgi:glutathione S-transferase